MEYGKWKMLLPSYRRRRWARDRRLRTKDGSTSGHITGPEYRPDSLSAQDVLRDREAHHQPEFIRLPTFKQVDGAIKILPRQRGEERDDAPRMAAPAISKPMSGSILTATLATATCASSWSLFCIREPMSDRASSNISRADFSSPLLAAADAHPARADARCSSVRMRARDFLASAYLPSPTARSDVLRSMLESRSFACHLSGMFSLTILRAVSSSPCSMALFTAW